ncbi:hypothetical protein [Reichenbachiella agariperforans]|uniref:hypothetical protein n=1 Tax=Reichenbachiella agariperforans TaxID=156994 RepID=UPI001C09ADED|nr:hypothetical protein [Reichenbachiella agariperforans]MBU2914338.1 hypothetical protein [Reichenbachiella agariperforans]
MTEKYIQYLQELRSPSITDGYTLSAWKSKAVNVITRIYGDGSKQEDQINGISFRSYPRFGTVSRDRSTMSGGGNNSHECQKLANSIIEGIVSELESFGLPEEKNNPSSQGINISVSQSNSQDVKINLNIILSALQDELTDTQLTELQGVLDETTDEATKRDNIITKVKSFGSDILSNILANILTNPQLYG